MLSRVDNALLNAVSILEEAGETEGTSPAAQHLISKFQAWRGDLHGIEEGGADTQPRLRRTFSGDVQGGEKKTGTSGGVGERRPLIASEGGLFTD